MDKHVFSVPRTLTEKAVTDFAGSIVIACHRQQDELPLVFDHVVGGYYLSAFRIMEIMKGYSLKYHNHIHNKALSSGMLLAVACSENVQLMRSAHPEGVGMLHSPRIVSKQFGLVLPTTQGKDMELIKLAGRLAQDTDRVAQILSLSSNKSERWWQRSLRGEDMYFSAQEMLKKGLIDLIIEKPSFL